MSPLVLVSEFNELELALDERTGLPARLRVLGQDSSAVVLRSNLRLEVGGDEVAAPLGGLAYVGCHVIDGVGMDGGVSSSVLPDSRSFMVRGRAEDWRVCLTYRFRMEHPRISVSIELTPPDDGVRILRNLHLDMEVVTPDPASWLLQAPGSRIRPDLALDDLTRPVAVSPAAGLKGSAGLVALEDRGSRQTFIWWPFSRSEIGDQHVRPGPAGPTLAWQTDLSGEPAVGGSLSSGSVHLDLVPDAWSELLSRMSTWLSGVGVQPAEGAPGWVARARIFEVQIGFSVFHGGWRYSPYPTAADLLDDLDRIHSLGFTVIQLMPRHPFPSYNVHDYADVTTSWGEEDVLRELVHRCHQRGMRVIFDILLHGVVDREAVAKAADGVRTGVYATRLDEVTVPLWKDDGEPYFIAYSRHIIDFEPFWSAGSPERHPLADEHPEWFCRNSAGEVIGVYTKAFDNAHPGWQQYFIDSCVALIERLDLDGYRFDAPTYNYFANWSDRTRTHAGVSMVGSLALFRRLRPAVKAVKPDAMLYTEPSGVLLRESMDVNYNYDEQWLFPAVVQPAENPNDQEVRNAHELGRWLQHRDALLPAGSITAHHIDSHDTFWWPLPGEKWMREQFGIGPTRALTGVFALSGGPFMMFVGGEEGVEDDLRTIARLRDARPELAVGESDYTSVTVDDPSTYAVVRRGSDQGTLVLVNLGTTASRVRATVTSVEVGPGSPPPGLDDLYAGRQLSSELTTNEEQETTMQLTVDLPAHEICVVALP